MNSRTQLSYTNSILTACDAGEISRTTCARLLKASLSMWTPDGHPDSWTAQQLQLHLESVGFEFHQFSREIEQTVTPEATCLLGGYVDESVTWWDHSGRVDSDKAFVGPSISELESAADDYGVDCLYVARHVSNPNEWFCFEEEENLCVDAVRDDQAQIYSPAILAASIAARTAKEAA